MEPAGITTERFRRRLAAVLMMDIAGYSRLSETDVEGTHARLRAIMNDVVMPHLQTTGGRIVKRTGDGALIEFPSVTEAMRAASAIQQQTALAESDRPPDRRIQLRMGINLGDIIVEDDNDIYGDGVNIAARLEAIGQPGDVIVSEAAMQTVDRAGYRFVDLGPQRLKNISRPVRAFRLVLADAPATDVDDAGQHGHAAAPGRAGGFHDRPGVAVLPFKIQATMPEHEGFADAITEDIIAGLARWRSFPVVSRNSAFAYKGRDVDLKAVAQQLGVRYVVEGSLRWRGQKLRSNIELVDVDTMDHLLSEQYEHEADSADVMQDEMVRTIVTAIHPELARYERERAARVPVQAASPYELLQRGLWHHYRYTREDSEAAAALFRQVAALDPTNAQAPAALAVTLVHAANTGWTADQKATYQEAFRNARMAVQTDPRDPQARFALGVTYQNTGFPDEAIAELQEAVRLNPNYGAAYANLSTNYGFLNKPDLALPAIELALRLMTHDPRRFIWLPCRAVINYLSRNYRPALEACQQALAAKPDFPVAIRYLVATLGQLGRTAEAAAVIPLLRRLDGDIAGSEAYWRRMFNDAAVRHLVEGLQKAGFK